MHVHGSLSQLNEVAAVREWTVSVACDIEHEDTLIFPLSHYKAKLAVKSSSVDNRNGVSDGRLRVVFLARIPYASFVVAWFVDDVCQSDC